MVIETCARLQHVRHQCGHFARGLRLVPQKEQQSEQQVQRTREPLRERRERERVAQRRTWNARHRIAHQLAGQIGDAEQVTQRHHHQTNLHRLRCRHCCHNARPPESQRTATVETASLAGVLRLLLLRWRLLRLERFGVRSRTGGLLRTGTSALRERAATAPTASAAKASASSAREVVGLRKNRSN